MEKLFSEFSPSTASDWKAQITKDLKGAAFENLIWHNANGFDIQPFYTSEDIKERKSPVFSHADWEINEDIIVDAAKEANALALKSLNGGASSLTFILKQKPDFIALLNEISIEHIQLNFVLRYTDKQFLVNFHSYLDKLGIPASKIKGSISYDAIGNLVQTGNWFKSQEEDLKFNNTSVDTAIYHNAGATQVFELACAIAHAHEYVAVSTMKAGFHFSVAVGSDFFGEIAKLRALRKLWALVANEYKMSPEIKIHCKNSEINTSSLDAYNNMLRSTTEGMSAVIGGCNSLTLEAYNKSFETSDDFGTRIARNQQLIFKEESYLNKVADMGAGSYYIESLTDELVSKAWEEFKIIESKGGFIACLKSNYIQNRIKTQAELLINLFREGKTILVGVNKFQNKSEQPVKTRPNFKRITTGATINPIVQISLSDY